MTAKDGAIVGLQGKTYRGVVVAGRGFGAQRMSQPALLQAAKRLTDLNLTKLACLWVLEHLGTTKRR